MRALCQARREHNAGLMQDTALRVAIAARVVDNFGDAGVAWRLARQLRDDHAAEVTLWIDAPEVLAHLVPAIDPHAVENRSHGVRVRRLGARDDALAPAPGPLPLLVVEAFGCGLPASWLAAMERAPHPPVWLNLEYLSAEAWIDGAHGLPSPHPTRKLTRWFVFPGFTPRSGGLLRERSLFARRDAFTALPDHRAQPWTSLGLPAPPADALTVSLFCYPTPVVATLLRTWAQEPRPVAVLVPEGVASEAVAAFAGRPLRAGDTIATGTLSLAVVPFVDPDAFDRRLWSCDLAVVRGEDSFLRAQWAARPFAWHIYPTADDAHQVKLEAFLARYTAGLAAGGRPRRCAPSPAAFNAGDGHAVARAPGPPCGTSCPRWRGTPARGRTRAAASPISPRSLLIFIGPGYN